MQRFKLSLCGQAVTAAFSQTTLASEQSEAQVCIQNSIFNLLTSCILTIFESLSALIGPSNAPLFCV